MVEEKKQKDASASKAPESKAKKTAKKGGDEEAKAQEKKPVVRRRRITGKKPTTKKVIAAKKEPAARRETAAKKEPAARRETAAKTEKAAPRKEPEAAAERARKLPEPAAPKVEEKPSQVSPWAVSQAMEKEYSSQEFEEFLKMYEPTLSDIEEGEIVNGKVMGVTKEDVIVDVGFKSEGMISISEFPEPINIKVGDEIEVLVLSVDRERERIGLSRKRLQSESWARVTENLFVGDPIAGTVTTVVSFGAFVDVGAGVEGLLHVSEVPNGQLGLAELKPVSDVDVHVSGSSWFWPVWDRCLS